MEPNREAPRRILILAGMTFDGYQGDPVVAHFANRTDAFLKDVLEVGSTAELARRFHYRGADATFSAFRVDDKEARGRKICYSGAGHILYQEAREAGFEPQFAPIDGFFRVDESGRIDIAPDWADALDDVDVVALSTSFVLRTTTLYRLAAAIKSRGKILIVGGVLVNKLPDAALSEMPFDFCLKTEAEGRFAQILQCVALGAIDRAALDAIPGLLWREGDRLNVSPAPFALVDFVGWRCYPTPEWVQERRAVHQYESVRGCPFRCEFCDYPFLMGNKKFRMKPAERIFEDWQMLRRLGVRYVDALDSLFTVPKARAKKLAELLVASGLAQELGWACYARVTELADRDFVELLKRSGCRYVFLGVESGSQTILDNMRKKTNVEDAARAIRNCNDVGLYTSCGILVGFPGETERTVAETYEFLSRQSCPSVHIFVWIPDFTEDSPVPIMRLDRREKFGIGGEVTPSRYRVNVWGEEVGFELRTKWAHSSMTQEQALAHACHLSDTIRRGEIAGEDFSFAPYRSLTEHPGRLAAVMDFGDQVGFLNGWKSSFSRYLDGVAPRQLRAEVAGWLSASGFRPSDAAPVAVGGLAANG